MAINDFICSALCCFFEDHDFRLINNMKAIAKIKTIFCSYFDTSENC